MNRALVGRLLLSSAVFGAVLAGLVSWRHEAVTPVQVAVAALLLGTARVVVRSLSGQAAPPLSRGEVVGTLIPVVLLWLLTVGYDLRQQPPSLWTLTVGLTGTIAYLLASGALWRVIRRGTP